MSGLPASCLSFLRKRNPNRNNCERRLVSKTPPVLRICDIFLCRCSAVNVSCRCSKLGSADLSCRCSAFSLSIYSTTSHQPFFFAPCRTILPESCNFFILLTIFFLAIPIISASSVIVICGFFLIESIIFC